MNFMALYHNCNPTHASFEPFDDFVLDRALSSSAEGNDDDLSLLSLSRSLSVSTDTKFIGTRPVRSPSFPNHQPRGSGSVCGMRADQVKYYRWIEVNVLS